MKKTYYKNLFYLFVGLIILLIVFCGGNKKVFAAEQLDFSLSKYYPVAACNVTPFYYQTFWYCPQVAGYFSFDLPSNYSDVYMHDLCWDDKVYGLKINGTAVDYWGGTTEGCDTFGNHLMMQYVHSGFNEVYYDFRDTTMNSTVGGSFNITAKLKPGDFTFDVQPGCDSNNNPVNIITWTKSEDADDGYEIWAMNLDGSVHSFVGVGQNTDAGTFVVPTYGTDHIYSVRAVNANTFRSGLTEDNAVTHHIFSHDCGIHVSITGPDTGYVGQHLTFDLNLIPSDVDLDSTMRQTIAPNGYLTSDSPVKNGKTPPSSSSSISSFGKTFNSNEDYYVSGLIKVKRKTYDPGAYSEGYSGVLTSKDSEVYNKVVKINPAPSLQITVDKTCNNGTATNKINWNTIPGVTPGSYEIYRSNIKGSYPPNPLKIVYPPATSYTDTYSINTSTQYYIVNAYGGNANLWSNWVEVTCAQPSPTPTPNAFIKMDVDLLCNQGDPYHRLRWTLIVGGKEVPWSNEGAVVWRDYIDLSGTSRSENGACYPAANSSQCDVNSVLGRVYPGSNITYYIKFYGVKIIGSESAPAADLGTVESESKSVYFPGNYCTGHLRMLPISPIVVDMNEANYGKVIIVATTDGQPVNYTNFRMGSTTMQEYLGGVNFYNLFSWISGNNCTSNTTCVKSFYFFVPSTVPDNPTGSPYKVYMSAECQSSIFGGGYDSGSFDVTVKNSPARPTSTEVLFKGFFIGDKILIEKDIYAPFRIEYDPVAAQNPPPGFADLLAPFWSEATP